MATGCQGFDESEAKIFDSIGSSDDSDADNDNHESDSSSEGERTMNGSEDALLLNVVDAGIVQIGRENVLNFSSMDAPLTYDNLSSDEDGPVLREHWTPHECLSVGRSRYGFPDCHDDHLVQLLVCKNKHSREALDIADTYKINVAVSYDTASGSSSLKMPDCQCKRIKINASMTGVVGYLFRFHEPCTKYKISFSLSAIPPKKRGKKKKAKKRDACETISEISVTLKTGDTGRPRKKVKAARIVPPSFELNSASLSEESMVLSKRSSWVMNQLQSRRDNAMWEDFDKSASDLLLKFADTDTQIAIKLEQSVEACYQNKLERSIQLLDESFRMIPQAKNQHLLTARCYGYRAGVMRRQRHLGDAHRFVQLAEQNNHACHTNLDTSFIVYERASVLLDFIGRTPQRSAKQVNEALSNLEKCIDMCLRVEMEDGDLYYVKKHHFAFIKIAMLLLDCRTEAARERVVSEEFIAKGQECLNTLKIKYWSEIAEGVKIQFNLASSDLEYRRGNFAEAEKFASLAKDMATELGFNTEISHAQERLDHTRVLTRGYMISDGTSPASCSESEGENGDVSSSGSESDWLRILE